MEIFVSRPTWVAPEFESGLSTLLTQLDNLDLVPRTLGVSDYPRKAPLDEVIEIMATCQGAIVLGYPQLEVEAGFLKGGKINSPMSLGTEWNHLEAGLAYAAGLPLLVIHHTTVSRGIFDRGVLNAFLHSVDLSESNWSMQASMNGAIKRWKKACIDGESNYRNPSKQTVAKNDKPICPNCSDNKKRMYMKPIPPPFSELAGGEWECPQCRYVE